MFEIIPRSTLNPFVSFNPFKEMEEFEKRFFSFPEARARQSLEMFRTDIREEDGKFILEADLPGFEKKDINVKLEGDYLTVRAERKSESEEKDEQKNYVRRERSYGSYARSFDVSGIDTENIAAKYENGVLALTLPKKEEKAPASRQFIIE